MIAKIKFTLITVTVALIVIALLPIAVLADSEPPEDPTIAWELPTDSSYRSSLSTTPSQGSIVSAFMTDNNGQRKNKYNENEIYFLEVSINQPGFLWVAEYYPTGSTGPSRHWILQNYRLPNAGTHRIQFSPEPYQPEGKYVWALWFNPIRSQLSTTVRWEYGKEAVVVQQPTLYANTPSIDKGQSTNLIWSAPGAIQANIANFGSISPAAGGSVPVTPDTTTNYTLVVTYGDGTTKTASAMVNVKPPDMSWLIYLLLTLLAIAAVAVVLVIKNKRQVNPIGSRYETGTAGPYQPANTTKLSPTVAGRTQAYMPPTTMPVKPAKLVFSDNSQIQLGSLPFNLGRRELQNYLSPDKADYISRQHAVIGLDRGEYYIEEMGSRNGTNLNGIDIRTSGRCPLRNGDIIDIADALIITFIDK